MQPPAAPRSPGQTSAPGAGLVPFDRWGNDTVLLCLGLEADDSGWSAWGGSAQPSDGGEPLATAVREACEESLLVLGSPEDLARAAWPRPVHTDPGGFRFFAVPMRCRHSMAQAFARERRAVDDELRSAGEAAPALRDKKALMWVDARLLLDDPRWQLRPAFRFALPRIVAAIADRSSGFGRRRGRSD